MQQAKEDQETIVSFFPVNPLSVNGYIKGGKFAIGGKMGVEVSIKATAGDVELKNEAIEAIVPKVTAKGTMQTYFEGELKIESDSKGIYIEPVVTFGGLKFTLDIEVKVGWFTRSCNIEERVIDKEDKSLGKKYITD